MMLLRSEKTYSSIILMNALSIHVSMHAEWHAGKCAKLARQDKAGQSGARMTTNLD